MYAWLFIFLFHGLAVLALLCLVALILNFVPFALAPLRRILTKLIFPVLATVDAITPNIVPRSLHAVIAAFWLLSLRVGFYLGAAASGLLPGVAS
jgi:hypothetical protein